MMRMMIMMMMKTTTSKVSCLYTYIDSERSEAKGNKPTFNLSFKNEMSLHHFFIITISRKKRGAHNKSKMEWNGQLKNSTTAMQCNVSQLATNDYYDYNDYCCWVEGTYQDNHARLDFSSMAAAAAAATTATQTRMPADQSSTKSTNMICSLCFSL